MTLVIALSLLQFPTVSGAAQSSEAPPPSDDMEEIVVTGTPPRDAVIGDIPAENQLHPTDIASYGVSTISDLLNEISDMTESDQGRDNSGPIILVNGKRVSGVNEVGDLPTESILRLDILPEEVALKYGYGAQQKVVNIILRRRFQAFVADLVSSESTEGAGEGATGDLSYSRIRNNDRVNVVGRVKNQESLLESDRGVSSNADESGDDSHARTLQPATRTYTFNGVAAHPFSDTLSASFNAKATWQTSHALNGFPSADLDVPASSPYAQSDSDTTVDRFLSGDALHQDLDSTTAHAGVTLNADLPKKWRLSMIGNYDHVDAQTEIDRGYDVTGLQAGIDDGEIDPYGPLPPATLGPLRREDVRSVTNTGSASVLVNGGLAELPAGEVTVSMKMGGDFSSLDASRTAVSRTSSRSTGSGQISVDVPLTGRTGNILPAIGNLTANLTGAVSQISGFGSLDTFGYGLYWTPHKGVSFIASINEDRQAPTLAQLNDPVVTTTNLSTYDQVTGQTVTVSRISGGNPDLKADDRHVMKLGVTLAPTLSDKNRLNITANYIHSVTRNAIGTISGATPQTEQAFPDRFERDDDGTLVSIDSRPVNFDRQEREDIRWGFNLTHVIRAPTRPTRPPGARDQRMRSGPPAAAGDQGGLAGAPGPQEGGEDSRRPAPSPDGTNPADATPGDASPPGGTAPDGARPQRGGGGGGGGYGQFGGGGGGGGGGGRRAAASSGGGNGSQFQMSLYHTWYFRDDVRLSAGGPPIDLLNGGTIGSGGQPRHKVQLNAGWLDNGLGLRFSGDWISGTQILDNGSGSGPLFFSSLATFDVRLIANLQQRFVGKAWAEGTRLTLALNNVFDAHQDIHDADGVTPRIYQPAFLDPYGRTVSLSFRKLF